MVQSVKLLTPAEAAAVLRLSARKVRAMVREGKLPGLALDHVVRVDATGLERLVGAAARPEEAAGDEGG